MMISNLLDRRKSCRTISDYSLRRGSLLLVLLLLLIHPVPAQAGVRPTLLRSDDTILITLLLVLASPLLLAPLFSAIFFLSRRDACKWAAIIFTGLLVITYTAVSGGLGAEWLSVVPIFCVILVMTKLWMRAVPKRYVLLSLLWGIAMLKIWNVLSMRLGLLFGLLGPSGYQIVFWTLEAIVIFGVSVAILRGNSRRAFPMPPLPQFAGFIVLMVVLETAIFTAIGFLLMYVDLDRHRGVVVMSYEGIAIRIGIAALTSTGSWFWYSNQRVNNHTSSNLSDDPRGESAQRTIYNGDQETE
jgi:hypothetical protein